MSRFQEAKVFLFAVLLTIWTQDTTLQRAGVQDSNLDVGSESERARGYLSKNLFHK